jgi:hydroxymethylbilane synthase
MNARRTIKIGSRGSGLALTQDEELLALLRPLYPELDFQVITVRTHGDINTTGALAEMGLGIFVREIERDLLAGDLDIAVHSLKDLPTELPQGLALGAIMERHDPRDVLVNRWGCGLDDLPEGARIGTSSPRRQALLNSLCPQAVTLPIRGNVETRLQKAQGEDYDGTVLAAAGLLRLGLSQHISAYLEPEEFVPPPGQGALGIQIRSDDKEMLELLSAIDHQDSRCAVTAERGFLEVLGGGCQLPMGAYARKSGESLLMNVFLGSGSGMETSTEVFAASVEGPANDPIRLANDAHRELANLGAAELLEAQRTGDNGG